MLTPPDSGAARSLTGFLRDATFTADSVRHAMGTERLASRRLRNLPFLLYRTSETSALNTLIRWFLLDIPADAPTVRNLFPDHILAILRHCGLLSEQEGKIWPQAMLAPFEGTWIASDFHSRAYTDDVVIPINLTTQILLRFAIRTPAETVLDLGTGSGAVALQLAPVSQIVVATDLNPRALEFARFSAALNGVRNIEFLAGDGFAPVEGRKFDRIFCNPPFFITPGSAKMYSENPQELDGFCASLIRRAPAHLNEGGTLQMLAEWVKIKGQSWQERITEWFTGSGCDAWILSGQERTPEEYALARFREIYPNNSPEDDQRVYDGWIEYYRRYAVDAVLSGFVCLRRRAGDNWIRFEPMPETPSEPFGEAIGSAICTYDFLDAIRDDQLPGQRFKIAGTTQMEQRFRREGGEWQLDAVHFESTKGPKYRRAMTPAIAEFLGKFDGTRTLGDLIDELALQVPASPEAVRRECIALVRRMIEFGFLVRETSERS